MTVTTLNSSYSATANGTNRTFQFNFALLEEDHLYVYTITTSGVATLESDYVVNDFGDEGGSITFSEEATPASGETVLMQRNVPVTQETDYIPNDPFPAEVHEDALDKLTMIVQDSSYNVDRCITVPIGDTATDLELPFATDRAEKYLWFDEDGNVTTTSTLYGDVYSTDEIDDLLTNYYTSDEVDTLLNDYYTSTQVDTLLNDYYTSDEVDNLITTVSGDIIDYVDSQIASLTDYYNVVGDWNKQQYFGIATITGVWDLDVAQTAQWTLGATNSGTNPTNMKAGGSYMLKVIQDDTGSRTITWDTAYKWEDDTAPEISAGANEVSIITFLSDGTYMYGTLQWKETL